MQKKIIFPLVSAKFTRIYSNLWVSQAFSELIDFTSFGFLLPFWRFYLQPCSLQESSEQKDEIASLKATVAGMTGWFLFIFHDIKLV